MSFLDDLAKFLSNKEPEDNNNPQPKTDDGEADTPEEVKEELEEYDPEKEKQGLFALGFMSDDVSPDVRHDARQAYEDEHGPLTSDDWQAWRDEKYPAA